MKKPKKVVIVGGGIAGLSAAHELVERGFDVHVYERRSYFGGKAASVTIPKNDKAGRGGLPGEHGFRFFPGWYRHLPDTMARIKYRDRTVADNLVATTTNLFASYQRDPIKALLRLPSTRKETATASELFDGFLGLGLTTQDLSFFMGKLWEFLTASEERRVAVYDNMTWWDFLEADKQTQAFRDYLVVAVTRSSVAARPRQASAYTIAKMAIQSVLDTVNPLTSVDRVLNGPTQEVFVDPWIDYLTEQGVTFHRNAELESIQFEDATPQIRSLKFSFHAQAVRDARARYELSLLRYEVALAAAGGSKTPLGTVADDGSIDVKIERAAARVMRGGDSKLLEQRWRTTYAGASAAKLKNLGRWSRRYFDRYQKAVEAAQEASRVAIHADYFVFAIPVEQMAYQVRVSEMMRFYDPTLVNIIRLSECVDWMAGVQFYLSKRLEITRGHIACLDSPWQLTALEQTQFWTDLDVKIEDRNSAQVKSVLSVDISAWDRPGDLFGTEAFNCSKGEIANEVWFQLKKTLNRPGQPPALRDEWLVDFKNGRVRPGSYHIDDSIVDRFDRKKQAVYDKSATVRFDAGRLVAKQTSTQPLTDVPYAHGRRLQINAEPLLISRVGSLALRPSVKTKISNMFLAGDYVRTMTNLATMEGANEAARAAVNEIILASGMNARLCELWPLKEPLELFRTIDTVLFRRKRSFQDSYADIPVRIVAGAATAATTMVAKTLEKILDRRRQP